VSTPTPTGHGPPPPASNRAVWHPVVHLRPHGAPPAGSNAAARQAMLPSMPSMSMAQHHVGSPFAFPSVSSPAAAAAAATPPPAAAALYFVHGVTPTSLGGTPTWVPVEPIVMPRSPEELDAAALAHAGIASSTAAEAAVATARAANAAKTEAAQAAAAAAAKPGEQAKKASPPGPASATPCSRCTAPLTEERQHQPNLVCDGGCGRTFRPGQLRLACLGCDFDLCARCSRSGQSKRPRDADCDPEAHGLSATTPAAIKAGTESSTATAAAAGKAARSSAAPGSATATEKLFKSRGRTALPA